MSEDAAAQALWVMVALFLTIITLVVTFVDLETEPTCPNYGEVPALIDGGYECIPWEVQP